MLEVYILPLIIHFGMNAIFFVDSKHSQNPKDIMSPSMDIIKPLSVVERSFYSLIIIIH